MSKELVESYKDIRFCLNENFLNDMNISTKESINRNKNNYSVKNGKNIFYKKNKRKNNNYNGERSESNFEIRRGDWFCQFCFNLNFAFRKQCNKCNNSKIVYIFGKKKLPLFRKFCIE